MKDNCITLTIQRHDMLWPCYSFFFFIFCMVNAVFFFGMTWTWLKTKLQKSIHFKPKAFIFYVTHFNLNVFLFIISQFGNSFKVKRVYDFCGLLLRELCFNYISEIHYFIFISITLMITKFNYYWQLFIFIKYSIVANKQFLANQCNSGHF